MFNYCYYAVVCTEMGCDIETGCDNIETGCDDIETGCDDIETRCMYRNRM